MTWGTFTPAHIVTLVAAVAMIVGLYFILKNRSDKCKIIVLGVLSLWGVAAIIFNLVVWDAPLAYLPLHLCSLNAMMLPIAVFSRNKTICNLLLVWCLGALAAIVLNYEVINIKLWSWEFFFYYFPHVMECGIPVLLFALKLVKKDPKCIVSTMVISMAIYTVVHLLNVWINAWCMANQFGYGGVYQANYMFSIQATNPLVALFAQIIPAPYWHMYMVLPIVLVYLLIVYAPEIYRKLKNKECVTV